MMGALLQETDYILDNSPAISGGAPTRGKYSDGWSYEGERVTLLFAVTFAVCSIAD